MSMPSAVAALPPRLLPGIPSMDPSARYSAVPGCLATSLGEEMIVLELESGVYFGLNPVAASVWGRLSSPCTHAELVAAVEAEFDTAGADTDADVRELLATLRGHGMVVETGIPAAV